MWWMLQTSSLARHRLLCVSHALLAVRCELTIAGGILLNCSLQTSSAMAVNPCSDTQWNQFDISVTHTEKNYRNFVHEVLEESGKCTSCDTEFGFLHNGLG